MLPLLAMASARMEAFFPGSFAARRVEPLNTKALKQLQSLNQENLDYRALYDIACLAAAALYLDNHDLIRAHLLGFNRISRLITFNPLEEHLLHFVMVLDVTFAMSTDKKPMLAWPNVLRCTPTTQNVGFSTMQDMPLDIELASQPEDTCLVSSKSPVSFSMGFGLVLLNESVLFPVRMQELLQEVSRCAYLGRWVFKSQEATSDDASALCMSLLRLHHSLLSERFNGIAEALRLCLFLNLSYLRTKLSPSSANWNAVRLVSMVDTVDYGMKFQEQIFADLLLWMCVVGASAAADPDLQDWYIDRSVQAARVIGLAGGNSSVQTHVEKYFYMETGHHGTVAKVELRLMSKLGNANWDRWRTPELINAAELARAERYSQVRENNRFPPSFAGGS